jgi:N6-adenosine-specific RNA methylase IME4
VKYSVIVADPPWSFSDKLTMSSTKRGAAANYRLLGLEDIVAMPVQDVSSDDAVLALWVPSSMIADGLRTMAAWGFKQKTIWTWVKTSRSGGLAFGMGRTFRGCSEHALVGTRGRPRVKNRSQRNVALDPAMKHSAKPDTLQIRLELMFEGERLELFARRKRPGWTTIGDQCPGTVGVDVRDWLASQVGAKRVA